MKSKGTWLALAALTAALGGGAAHAQTTFTWNPPNNNPTSLVWTSAASWSSSTPTKYPGEMSGGDIAVIPERANGQPTLDANVTVAQVTINNPAAAKVMLTVKDFALTVGAANGLTVPANAELRIEDDGGRLIFAAASSGHVVNGDITLQHAQAEVQVTANTELDGAGAIVGVNGIVRVDSGDTLTIDGVSIEGQLGVQGSGTLANKGTVRATSGTTLTLSADTTLSDIAGHRWVVDGGDLSFARDFTLAGNFVYTSGGEFHFITTAICYETTGGLFAGGTRQNTCPTSPDPLVFTGTAGFTFKNVFSIDQQCGGCAP